MMRADAPTLSSLMSFKILGASADARKMTVYCPFSKDAELNSELEGFNDTPHSVAQRELPGYPGLYIGNTAQLRTHLESDLYSEKLDQIAPKLWVMSTQSSANISPLHRQMVKGRNIFITEDPKLHLTWIGDRIFLKPLPPYLLSWTFWSYVLDSTSFPLGHRKDCIRRWSLGILRTYAYLIRHQSDFNIAKRQELIPDDVSWAKFRRFSNRFVDIPDSAVSPRYAYGELRLSRLNFYTRLFLRQGSFLRTHHQYGAYFAQFYGPLLFVLGLLSVMLSAMQVAAASGQLVRVGPIGSGFWVLCGWFSIVTLGIVAFVCLLLGLLLSYKLCKEWFHAIKTRFWKDSKTRAKADLA